MAADGEIPMATVILQYAIVDRRAGTSRAA